MNPEALHRAIQRPQLPSPRTARELGEKWSLTQIPHFSPWVLGPVSTAVFTWEDWRLRRRGRWYFKAFLLSPSEESVSNQLQQFGNFGPRTTAGHSGVIWRAGERTFSWAWPSRDVKLRVGFVWRVWRNLERRLQSHAPEIKHRRILPPTSSTPRPQGGRDTRCLSASVARRKVNFDSQSCYIRPQGLGLGCIAQYCNAMRNTGNTTYVENGNRKLLPEAMQ
jgi:hypothetical protein